MRSFRAAAAAGALPPLLSLLLLLLLLLLLPVLVCGAEAQHGEYEPLAVMEAFPALAPRWYPGSGSSDGIVKRQDVLSCEAGWHSCLDVGDTGICCPNDRYCIKDPQGNTRCCAIGSTCESQCPADQFQCNRTTTTTLTATATASGSATLVPSTSVRAFAACCSRRCRSTSQFACPSPLGTGCCGYGSTCASDNQCIFTKAPEPTTLVTQVPEGCTTSQVTCAQSLGGGCCPVRRACTLLSGTRAVCVTTTATVVVPPTDSGVVAVDQPDAGLSAGAKAGIAVGVVVGSALVIGAATWMCIRRRRHGGSGSSGRRSMSQAAPPGSIPVIIGGSDLGGGYGGMNGPISRSASDSRGPATGRDYFGPDAVPGPYTDTGADTRDTTPGFERGVPAEPHGPNDIVAPVELGDSVQATPGLEDGVGTFSGVSDASGRTPQPSEGGGRFRADSSLLTPQSIIPETADGLYELYGTEVPTEAPDSAVDGKPEEQPHLEQHHGLHQEEQQHQVQEQPTQLPQPHDPHT